MRKPIVALVLALLMLALPAMQVTARAPTDVEPVGLDDPLVNPARVYTYEIMTADLQALQAAYPGLIAVQSIGQTPFGREIWAVRLGTGPATVLLNGSHHAREWLGSTLLVYMLEQYARARVAGEKVGDYDVKQVLAECSIWFVPMVNPDGVTLQQAGPDAFPPEHRERLIALNGGSEDFARWKANAEGVDLNHQYPADWENVPSPPGPSWANYRGAEPLSAPEVRALRDFTFAVDPEMTVSYHSSGRILYWHYHNQPEHLERDQRLAEAFGRMTGYDLVPPMENPSGGGYKDWFIQEFGRPGFTPELGAYVHETNLPVSAFAEEWERNRQIGLFVAAEGFRLWYARHVVPVTIDGADPGFGAGAVVLNGQTFAPLDALAEKLGATVTREGEAVIVARGERRVVLHPGSRTARVGESEVALPNPPQVLGGTLLAPLRLVVEGLGGTVRWDEAGHSVAVTAAP